MDQGLNLQMSLSQEKRANTDWVLLVMEDLETFCMLNDLSDAAREIADATKRINGNVPA